jgi:hypothetical protein
VFLVLAGDYIAGRYDLVRTISSRFQQFGAADEVRALFVDEEGQQVFLPSPSAKQKPTARRRAAPKSSDPGPKSESP